MTTLNPEEFLKTMGIELKTTTLISCIDGHMRQPNLVNILEEYHKAKLSELDLKITPESTLYDAKIIQMPVITPDGGRGNIIDGYPG